MSKPAYALTRDAIGMLAWKFIAANRDLDRIDIVSCLGFAPYNHAHFILQLEQTCDGAAWAHMRRAYFDIVSQAPYVSEQFEPVEY
jgi:hypothetical protein